MTKILFYFILLGKKRGKISLDKLKTGLKVVSEFNNGINRGAYEAGHDKGLWDGSRNRSRSPDIYVFRERRVYYDRGYDDGYREGIERYRNGDRPYRDDDDCVVM